MGKTREFDHKQRIDRIRIKKLNESAQRLEKALRTLPKKPK